MLKFVYVFLFIFLLFGSSKSQNIVISSEHLPNEPSITLDPKNPANIIAATNLDNYYISRDTGRTWTIHQLSSSMGVWGDPVIAVDTNSNFYYFHLSNPPSGNWIDRIICQKSTNNGTTWSDGSFAGLNGQKAQDKQWCAIDRSNNNMYLTWTQFDEYGTQDPTKKSIILFSKSVDGGNTWSPTKKINSTDGDCVDGDQTVEGAVPAVGPNGEIYVAWAGPNGLVFNRSTNQGNTWLSQEIKIDPMPTGWDYGIPGISRANGLPITSCDLSGGPNHGTIYVNWSDQRNGENDTDIWLSKSVDRGNTWSAPKRVNDDGPGKQQFFTWMTIDQTNGYLYFVFYDRRNHTDNSTDVFLAVSKDGGETFINRKISASPFIPNENIFFGDYTNITAHNNIVRPIWTRLHNGQLSILTDVTPINTIISAIEPQADEVAAEDITSYPNPSNGQLYFSYKLKRLTRVSLDLLDINGAQIAKIIDDEQQPYGKYIKNIDLSALEVPSGMYLLSLKLDGKITTEKKVVIQK